MKTSMGENMKKIVWFFLCFCLVLPLMVSCGAKKEKLGYLLDGGAETHPGTVLTLQGKEISFEEFRYFYLKLRDSHLESDPEYFDSEEKESLLKEEALKLLLNKRAAECWIEEEGVSLSSEEKDQIDEDTDHAVEIYGGSESFLAMIHDSYMSLDYYNEMMTFTALRTKLMDHLYGEGGKMAWDDERFYDYYRENYLAVQVIKLAYRAGETAENYPETLAEMAAIEERAKNGEDFWALIEECGEDDNMEAYPDGYYVTEGEAEEALYQAAKALGINEISEPVAGAGGLYLLRRVELKESRMDQNRAAALQGYTDSAGAYHAGAYDDEFEALLLERAAKLSVSYGKTWDLISTKTVF